LRRVRLVISLGELGRKLLKNCHILKQILDGFEVSIGSIQIKSYIPRQKDKF